MSYQSSFVGDSENEHSRLSNSIATNIQKISQNVKSMQRMVNQLGTSQDNENLRSQLHQLQNTTNELARDANAKFKKLSHLPKSDISSEQKHRRVLIERLTNEFLETLNKFQEIQRVSADKEKQSVIRTRTNSGLDNPFNNESNDDHLVEFGATNSKYSSQVQIEENDLHDLLQREKDIQRLETDIIQVNAIFKDMAALVHEQGSMIDTIEANVEQGAIHVEEGVVKLIKARELQSKARRKKFCIIIVLAIILVVIGVLIWVFTKK